MNPMNRYLPVAVAVGMVLLSAVAIWLAYHSDRKRKPPARPGVHRIDGETRAIRVTGRVQMPDGVRIDSEADEDAIEDWPAWNPPIRRELTSRGLPDADAVPPEWLNRDALPARSDGFDREQTFRWRPDNEPAVWWRADR